MTKEMYVSSTPHETKVGLVEDDQLAEIFFERENEYTLAGSIYKGRVTRVLPGMQSAFVDIGLERDAFLYVSDFLELAEDEESEFDSIAVTRPETFVSNRPAQQPEPRFQFKPEAVPPAELAEGELEEEEEPTEGNTQEFAEVEGGEENRGGEDDRFRGNRRRRRGRRGRGFPDAKFARPGTRGEEREEPEERRDDREAPSRDSSRGSYGPPPGYQPIILPGESLSKYRGRDAKPAEAGDEEQGPPSLPSAAPPTFIIESEDSDFEPVTSAPEATEAPQAQAERPTEAIPQEQPRAERSFAPRTPIVLPGESIAKYRRETPAEAGEQASAAPEAPPAEGQAAEPPPSEMPRPEPRPEAAKPETANRYAHRPRTERDPESYRPTGAGFSVLPGESLAKYRNNASARTEQMAREQATHAAESEERHAQQAATFVIESEPWAETLAHDAEPASEPSAAEIVESHGRVLGDDAKVQTESAHGESAAGPSSAEQPPSAEPPAPSDEARFEQMNVASVFGGGAAEQEVEPVESAHAETEQAATESLDDLEPAAPDAPAVEDALGEIQVPGGARADDERVFGRARAGDTLEHEEIEGEEEESHFHSGAEDDPDAEYIELEEETLEADAFARAVAEAAMKARTPEEDQLTEAVEENHAGINTAYESEAEETNDFDSETEFEEEELLGEDALPEGQQEEAIGRAEMRAPSATAGYQRSPERPYERRDRDRGRRGGRSGRGGRPMPRRNDAPRQHVQISDLLKEGQEVLVQIAKEPIGKKGARITSHIALPGRFLVYMPTVNHMGVSRKIVSEEERQRLKRIMLSEREGGHGGFIVRTAAAGVGEDELRADIRFLKNLWAQIKQRAENSKPPALIYHDLNLVERILRDQVTSDFSQIWVDNEAEYERILNFANRFQPSLVRRVKLYTRETPLFEQFGIQEEINKALKAKVWLKSGGYIVINQTEALVAIDINTGKYVGKTARLEDTIVKTNVDAIKEIVRQIRLRDLGGIIVIDFIDMDERKNRQKVMQALEEALRADRSPSKVLAFNDFGLVAITRKRVKQSLERTLGAPCPYCTGNGFVKSPSTVCNEIFVELRKMASHFRDTDAINLRVNPEIAKALKAEKGKWLQDFEEVTGRTVMVKPDPLLHQEQFDIHA